MMLGHIVVGHGVEATAYPSGASQHGIGWVRDTRSLFVGRRGTARQSAGLEDISCKDGENNYKSYCLQIDR